MADGLLPLNPATVPGGKIEDVEDLVGALATPVVRQRLQVTGAVLAEVARVLNISPNWDEYGLVVRPIPARVATPPSLVQFPADIAPVTLLAANPLRKGATFQTQFITNGSNLYIRLGVGVTTTLFHVALVPGAFYAVPIDPLYTGEITGVFDGTIGFVNVGELV